MAVLGLSCCVWLSLVVARGRLSLLWSVGLTVAAWAPLFAVICGPRCGGLSCFGAPALGCLGCSRCDLLALAALQHWEPSWTRDQTRVPCIGRWILIHYTTRKVLATFFSSDKRVDMSVHSILPTLDFSPEKGPRWTHLYAESKGQMSAWAGSLLTSGACLSEVHLCRPLDSGAARSLNGIVLPLAPRSPRRLHSPLPQAGQAAFLQPPLTLEGAASSSGRPGRSVACCFPLFLCLPKASAADKSSQVGEV